MSTGRRVAALSLCALAIFLPAQSFSESSPAPNEIISEWMEPRLQDDPIEKMRDLIMGINFLNNLSLDRKQLEVLLESARRIQAARAETVEALRRLTPGALPIYNEILVHVKMGPGLLDPDLRNRYFDTRDSAFQLANDNEKLRDAAVVEVEKSFKQFQLEIADGYIHCVNPEIRGNFIGGVRNPSYLIKALNRVRRQPESKYAHDKESICAQAFQKVKNRMCACDVLVDGSLAEKEFFAACDRVRQMTNVEFAVASERIADELLDRMTMAKTNESREKKIYLLLLQPSMIPIYEERLAKGGEKE